ncbi:hypothetical protein M011DRAFT_487676 [Sporormia fimetaria CBS 119925]|uniref:Uncharacterized protein n=1 Tax=Sporormia fimetaria CBS 119925 TaxID=1340428 RepID=A0A6A6V8W8_9PLEO|nr:hypothetical protein M011DRAFT_487676 [Sporormia fimetaria CBS 119925]
MFPTVGLFLTETVQGNMPSTTASLDARPQGQQGNRTLTERASFDRSSVRKTAEEVRSAHSSISTAFRFADFASQFQEASSEIGSFVHTIQRVRDDIFIATRLRQSRRIEDYCASHPEERSWIDNILLDVQSALNDMGVYVENVRVAGDEGGAVGIKRKFEWILSHHHKVRDRQTALLVCHQSLSTAINMMQMVEMGEQPSESGFQTRKMGVIYEAPSQTWLRNGNGSILRSPYSRQKYRVTQRNLGIPSITVDMHGEQKTEVPAINTEPFELPGSTPDDLPDPNNWDLYESPTSPPCPQSNRSETDPNPIQDDKLTELLDDDEPLGNILTGNVPILAQRYRGGARPVRVGVPKAPRHHSMPTTLPYIPQTPSLVEELNRWVSGYNFEHKDAPDEMDTPFTSNGSSPVAPDSANSCPPAIEYAGPKAGEKNRQSVGQRVLKRERAMKRARAVTVPAEDSPTLGQEPLSARKPESPAESPGKNSSEQKKSHDVAIEDASDAKDTEVQIAKTGEAANSNDTVDATQQGLEANNHDATKELENPSPPDKPKDASTAATQNVSTKPKVQTEEQTSEDSETVKTINPLASHPPDVPTNTPPSHDEETLPPLPPSSRVSKDSLSSIPLELRRSDTSKLEAVSLNSKPSVATLGSVETSSSQGDKPMTSMAKRRRARERRLQALYDDD